MADFAFLNYILIYFYWPSLLMLLFGLAGNMFLFLIYSKLRKLSVNLYYRVASLLDIFITFNWFKIFLREQYHFYLANISAFTCKTIGFSIYSSGSISSWLQVIISIDRLFHIVYSTKCSLLGNFKFQISNCSSSDYFRR